MYVSDLVNILAGLPPMMEIVAETEDDKIYFIYPIEVSETIQPPMGFLKLSSQREPTHAAGDVKGWTYDHDTHKWERIRETGEVPSSADTSGI